MLSRLNLISTEKTNPPPNTRRLANKSGSWMEWQIHRPKRSRQPAKRVLVASLASRPDRSNANCRRFSGISCCTRAGRAALPALRSDLHRPAWRYAEPLKNGCGRACPCSSQIHQAPNQHLRSICQFHFRYGSGATGSTSSFTLEYSRPNRDTHHGCQYTLRTDGAKSCLSTQQ